MKTEIIEVWKKARLDSGLLPVAPSFFTEPKLPRQISTKSGKRCPIKPAIRVDVFIRDKKRCRICGANANEVRLEIDHIIPVSKGGSDHISNLQGLCKTCNRGKSGRDLNANRGTQPSID